MNWFFYWGLAACCIATGLLSLFGRVSPSPPETLVTSGIITPGLPDSTRYTKIVLADHLQEPMQMEILPDNNVLLIERRGMVKLYKAKEKRMVAVANFNVFSGIEDGLLGVVADPRYEENHWVYFYYAVNGDQWLNRLSRFKLVNENLIMESEKVLLEIPTQRKYCCHAAGHITFDAHGVLYLATGDNTAASAASKEGYPPADEREGQELSDAQATSANSNDLRGKILRIKPERDGTYSIPDGNLFPKDGSEGRPEIYVMGCRNPFRISVDHKTGYLYWGDIGPNTVVRGADGTIANYDEINQAKSAGFFGWPYFIGNNDAYPRYDFASKKIGSPQDPLHPVNFSRNNTGIQKLPPAQPALIWYGIERSETFPLTGKGSASAMAGPVYYSDMYSNAPYKLSDYYEGKLFIYEWMRRWIMAVTLDEKGNYLSMEPFLSHMNFIAPIDMKFGNDGALYILEYGANWFAGDAAAKLVRVEYSETNRNPRAVITTDRQYGATPLEVHFSATESVDYDPEDQLSFLWEIAGDTIRGEEVLFTFNTPGIYEAVLTVKDDHGGSSTSTTIIKAGNTPPEVKIVTPANRSFYWDNARMPYRIEVTDLEDDTIEPDRMKVSFNYFPQGNDIAVVLAGGDGDVQFFREKQLLNAGDCNACHSMKEASVGPSYMKIAKRYSGKAGVVDQLSRKIINGGGGVWGDHFMTPHPDMSMENANQIVRYILSLADFDSGLDRTGYLTFEEHKGKDEEGAYMLMAAYTDKGANGIESLRSSNHLMLRFPRLKMEQFDEGTVRISTLTSLTFLTFITNLYHEGFVKFSDLDLTGVKRLNYRVQPQGEGGQIELRLNSRDGDLVSTLNVPPGAVSAPDKGWIELTTDLKEVSGMHDLFFVFVNPEAGQKNLFNLDWVHFLNH